MCSKFIKKPMSWSFLVILYTFLELSHTLPKLKKTKTTPLPGTHNPDSRTQQQVKLSATQHTGSTEPEAHLFLTPPAISHFGRIYNTDIGQGYKLRLFLFSERFTSTSVGDTYRAC